ncbi:Hypothetical Protein FCC1311_048922 [Hondaea fermentalgiana]|uniref:Uncharacterized protein n=1 Tax=Hondaea fermentalgiana TaxID=2315210 RepID=A0A2R5GK65_9STRA|nr:Hypothetical Protein FCC1311_048922 [Hondaea fermentalgiana]|eukprot:GBG28671.1 Hypothetical Protein FCC1311_048922 [Hondaea fermentalgiana]
MFGKMVDTSVCTSTVDVIAADLDPTAYCECDMTVEGAVVDDGEGGSYIDLAATCPEYISDDQTEMMELACQLACYSATDGACDAWHINWRNHHCSLFSCGQSTPVFEVVNDHSGGYSCDYVAVPTPEPTSWEARRLSSRASARNLFASRDESDARKKRKRGGRDLEMVDQDNVAELRKKRTRGDRDLGMVDKDNIEELRKKRTRGDRGLEEAFVDDTAELRKKRTRGGRELEEEVFVDDLDLSVENYRASGLMSSKRPEGRGRALGEIHVPSRRRELTERPETQVTVQFFALFSSTSDQEASVSKAVDSASAVESTVQSALSSADGFGDVEVTYIGQSPSYKIDGIRFPLAYDADQQSSATFLNAVCSALATTIAKRTSLSRVYCGTKLLDFRSIKDEAGDLVIMYRIENVALGRIQKMLRTNRGQNELKRQLAKSDIEYVKVLSASMPEYAEDDESAGNANTLAIALASVGALAVVALGTIFVVLKRRAKKREAASRQSDERLWNMVSYLSRAN